MEEIVREFIEQNAADTVGKNGAFCTGFVIAAELMDSEGEYYTWTVIDGKTAPWRLEGLLNYVVDNELYDDIEVEEEEDWNA